MEHMLELTAQDFENALNTRRPLSETYEEHVQVNRHQYQITIKNVKINEAVCIVSRDQRHSVCFINCIFEKAVEIQKDRYSFQGFKIEECTFQGRLNIGAHFSEGVQIIGSRFAQKVVIKETTFDKNLHIKEATFLGKVSLAESRINGAINIEGGIFKQGLEINKGSFKSSLTIKGGDFGSVFNLRETIISGNCHLTEIFFREGVKFYKSDLAAIDINNSKFKGLLEVLGGYFDGKMSIHGGTFEQGLHLSEEAKFGSGLSISGGEFWEVVEVSGCQFGSLDIGNAKFKKAFNTSESNFSGKLSITGGKFIGGCNITGGTFDGNFTIENGTFSRGLCISGATFKRAFTVSGGDFLGKAVKLEATTFESDFAIKAGFFKQGIQLEQSTLRSMKVEGGEFCKSFAITGSDFHRDVNIQEGDFQGGLNILSGSFSEDLVFDGGTYQAPVVITDGNFKKEKKVVPHRDDHYGREKERVIDPGTIRIREGSFEEGLKVEATPKGIFRKLVIGGGHFGKEVSIEGTSFINGLEVKSGSFGQGLGIRHGSFGETLEILQEASFGETVAIAHTTFASDFLIKGGEFSNGLELNACTLKGLFAVSGGKFRNKCLTMTNTIFSSKCLIKSGDFHQGLKIQTCTFEQWLQVSGGEFYSTSLGLSGGESLNISDTKVMGNCLVEGGTFNESLAIAKSIFKDVFEISDAHLLGKEVDIQDSHFEGDFVMKKKSIYSSEDIEIALNLLGNTFRQYFSLMRNKRQEQEKVGNDPLSFHKSKELDVTYIPFRTDIVACVFIQPLVIGYEAHQEDCTIFGSTFEQGLDIQHSSFNGRFELVGSQVKGALNIENSHFFQSTAIVSTEVSQGITLLEGSCKETFLMRAVDTKQGLHIWGERPPTDTTTAVPSLPEEVPKETIPANDPQFKSMVIEASCFGGEVQVTQAHFSGKFSLQGGIFSEQLSIAQCTFGQAFQLEGGKFQAGVYLENTTFRGALEVWGGAIKQFVLAKGNQFESPVQVSGGEIEQLTINTGIFEEPLMFTGKAHISQLTLVAGSFEQGLWFTGATLGTIAQGEEMAQVCFDLQNGRFDEAICIAGGTFLNEVNIVQGSFDKGLLIKDGVFEKELKVQGGTFGQGLHISGGVLDQVSIEGGRFEQKTTISGGKFSGRMVLKGGHFLEEWQISGGVFLQDVLLEDGKFDKTIQVSGGAFTQSVCISNGEYHNIDIDNRPTPGAFIHRLVFELATKISSQVMIKTGAKINELRFAQGIASSGMVYVQAIKLNQLTISNFTNKGTFELTAIRAQAHEHCLAGKGYKMKETAKPSQISLTESNLDNIIFNDVDFNSFDTIEIEAAKLNLISTIDRHFPTKKGKIKSRGKAKDTAKKIAEIYSQLYVAMQKQGYKTQEMEYYATFLYWECRAVRWKRKEVGKWLALSLHRRSTSFGRSWARGILWFFVFGLLMYFLYIHHLDWDQATAIPMPWQRWDTIGVHAQYYLTFINPIRKGSIIAGSNVGATVLLIDYLWRIILGYLTYQTITAFRRFGRK